MVSLGNREVFALSGKAALGTMLGVVLLFVCNGEALKLFGHSRGE